jgi:murein DD-endopeptidase MepM/ murein hydrolase activator NlpD
MSAPLASASLLEMGRIGHNWPSILAVCVIAGASAFGADVQAASRNGRWSIHLAPAQVANGMPLLIEVTPPAPVTSLTATWLGHDVVFDRATGRTWFALAGVSLETKPGSYPLKLEAVNAAGESLHFEQNLRVGHAKYPTIELKVSKQFTEPNPEQQQAIKKDQDIKQDAFARISPEREWSGPFEAPVDAETSDVFGTRRVFNGVTKSVHQGLDYRVGPGTPVMAVNRGTVLLARPLYFEGNCVVIDHGQGLLSLYLHLSEFKVKEGDRVERGTEVGLSGASGRATGPHLHLAVRWQGVYLNPAVLLRLKIPVSPNKSAAAQP